MAIRTIKHGYVVTTYPCNNGYVSEVINNMAYRKNVNTLLMSWKQEKNIISY